MRTAPAALLLGAALLTGACAEVQDAVGQASERANDVAETARYCVQAIEVAQAVSSQDVDAAVEAGRELVEVAPDRLETLPALFEALAGVPRAFLLFIDDIGFDEHSSAVRILRSLLEGGAEARPANVRLTVTSNRRHIVPRGMAEQDDPINPRDARDDSLALADRFGLSIGFHAASQDDYLAMVRAYADHFALDFDAADAVQWATKRGARSGRVAWQYAVELAGRAGRSLED